MNGPSLSWSKSRQEIFRWCRQKYLFQYYDYWNGWRLNAPIRTRRIYFLKNIHTLDAIVGLVAHQIIKQCLQRYQESGSLQDLHILHRDCEKKWSEIVDFTIKRHYKNKKGVGIKEFNDGIYEPDDLATKIDDSVQKTKLCLSQFHVFIRQQQVVQGDILTVDDNENGFMEIEVDGVTLRIYAIIDFAYLVGGLNEIEIIDWKTGLLAGEENTRIQLLNYGLYANNKWNIQPENIHFKVVKLAGLDVLEYTYSAEDYLQAIRDTEASIREMIAFERARTPIFFAEKKEICGWCQFIEICPKFGENSGVKRLSIVSSA